MTRQDAIEYDNWLKSGLMRKQKFLGLVKRQGVTLQIGTSQ